MISPIILVENSATKRMPLKHHHMALISVENDRVQWRNVMTQVTLQMAQTEIFINRLNSLVGRRLNRATLAQ